MRPTRLIAAVALACAAVPTASPAVVSSTCQGNFASAQSECVFFLAGPQLSVKGTSPAGYVSVAITDATGTVYLLSCDSGQPSSGGAKGCSAWTGFGTGLGAVQLPSGAPLRCRAYGYGVGTFSCSSFS